MKHILLFLVTLSSCSLMAQTEVAAFERISVTGNLRVVLTQGDEYSYTVTENIPDLKIRVVEGKLKISHKMNEYMWTNPTLIEVTYKVLRSVYGSGGAQIDHNGILEVGDLELNFDSGASSRITIHAGSLRVNVGEGGVLTLEGKARVLEAKATTGAVLKAMDFMATNVYVKANTGGNAVVYAVERIEATATLGGNIAYFGNPEHVTVREMMGGHVRG